MKKYLAFLTAVFCMVGFIACKKQPADPAKPDVGVYDVSKLYSTQELQLSDHVKELKDENGGIKVKTEFDIVSGTKMTLEILFKNEKFEDVKIEIQGADKSKYEKALEIELDTTPAPTEEAPQPQPSIVIKSNNPEAVKGKSIRLPRAGRTGANNKTDNPFDFDTKPDVGTATDHQVVGSAAFESLKYSVAAYRFVSAAKNVFGSYVNYTEAVKKPVATAWNFSGTLATDAAASATVKIENVLEFPLSYIVFVSSSAPLQHQQTITAMIRIEKVTHKIISADYAFYYVSEYRSEADAIKYTDSLANAKAAVIGEDATSKIYHGKSGEPPVYALNGIANATLTNSVLVNAFNAAFAYYNANLKA